MVFFLLWLIIGIKKLGNKKLTERDVGIDRIRVQGCIYQLSSFDWLTPDLILFSNSFITD